MKRKNAQKNEAGWPCEEVKMISFSLFLRPSLSWLSLSGFLTCSLGGKTYCWNIIEDEMTQRQCNEREPNVNTHTDFRASNKKLSCNSNWRSLIMEWNIFHVGDLLQAIHKTVFVSKLQVKSFYLQVNSRRRRKRCFILHCCLCSKYEATNSS